MTPLLHPALSCVAGVVCCWGPGWGLTADKGPGAGSGGFGRPGGDLLFRALRRSTIGAEGFHGRVRDGIGCYAPRYGHQAVQSRARPGEPGRQSGERLVERGPGLDPGPSPAGLVGGKRVVCGCLLKARLAALAFGEAAASPG